MGERKGEEVKSRPQREREGGVGGGGGLKR